MKWTIHLLKCAILCWREFSPLVHTFEFAPGDFHRLWRKSWIHGILYYEIFSGHGKSGMDSRCAKAAAMTVLYDHVTDGLGWRPNAVNCFLVRAESMLPNAGFEVLLRMMKWDQGNCLSNDGLERGVMSLDILSVYILGMPCCEVFGAGWASLGESLQLLDDAVDYEGDVLRGEMNAFVCNPTLREKRIAEIGEMEETLGEHGVRGPLLSLTMLRARSSVRQFIGGFAASGSERVAEHFAGNGLIDSMSQGINPQSR